MRITNMTFLPEDHDKLKEIYESIALSGDEKTTACDFNLRELEIDTGSAQMKDGDRVLDVGCGLGYALRHYATRKKVEGYGIDYAENMITAAKALQNKGLPLLGTVDMQHASVLDLPFPDAYFDVVTSSRCLMALLDWERQKEALIEIKRVLKPGGTLVLMEGTKQGLDRLNEARTLFDLPIIGGAGRDRLYTLKFDEAQLLSFSAAHYQLRDTRRFGMYYFITRVIHPLLVAPESPRFDAPINSIALDIARKFPDFQGMGHLVAFIFEKLR